MSEEKSDRLMKQFLKFLGILAVIILVSVIVGFGLLVGVCGILGKR
jgi:putative flippase GtrA